MFYTITQSIGKESRLRRRNNSVALVCMVIINIAVIAIIVYMLLPPSSQTLELSEIQDGIYVYQERVVSSVPAQNYTIITVCDINGNMLTIKGASSIVLYEDGAPYAIWEKSHMANSDNIILYVPKRSVEYLGSRRSGK